MQPGAPGTWTPPPPPMAPQLQFAGVGRRFVAYIVDLIILAIINTIVGIALGLIGLVPYKAGTNPFGGIAPTDINYVALIVLLAINLAISAAYFIYMWTTSRSTIGMQLLSVQIGNEGNGTTLTTEQAARRWAYLALPGALVTVLIGFPTLSALVSLLVLIYWIALLWTTYQSPTKQGLHDHWAHTQVVTRA